MTELYITFFVIGLLVFAAIAAYSWLQQSRSRERREEANELKKLNYKDPLLGDRLGDNASNKPELTIDASVVKKSSEKKNKEKIFDSLESKNTSKKFQVRISKQDKAVSKRKPEASRAALPVVEMTDELDDTDSNSKNKNSPKQQNSPKEQQIADNVEIINVQPKRDKRSSSIVTELVARIKISEPIEQKDLLTLFRNHDFKFHRSVHIYGLNQLTDLWRDIELELPSARFVELGVAIQLADREGAMSEKELHDFQQMALEFSNKLDAPFEFSLDIDEALIQAKVLDGIGRRYDSMAVLNIVPRSKTGFRVADIESCARDLGMTRSKNGIFLKTTGQKKQISILYRLACTNSSGDFGIISGTNDRVHDLVIYMNVPSTPTPERVFQEMVKDTNSLATWLEGKVVDKDGAVMTQRTYTVLTQQISDISFSMQQDGLMPGDSVCKKLF